MAEKKIKKWEPDEFELEMTTHWSFPKRGDWATHDAKWRGNWSPYIPRNLMLRYSREYEDLEGWTAFDDLMEELDTETEVQVHVEAYTYGDQETYKATPEEIAYFMKRMEQNENFLSDHCDNIEDADFSFVWSPDELFNMEIE